jgi:ABC-type branched-subunit amino acid transport system substrate-binding protein
MVTVAACSDGGEHAGGRHKLTLKIGALVPTSGTEQPFGTTGQKASELALGEIRKAIKASSADHTVSIEYENYRSETKLAQELASRLIRSGNSCLVGPWSTAATVQVGPVAVKGKVVDISPAASNDALSSLEEGGYVNRTIAPAHLQGEALATLMSHELGSAKSKKVSVGALKNLYGKELLKSFSSAWEKLGGKISAKVIYEQNLLDYKKQAKQLVARNPDAYVFFDFEENYTRVATELIKTGKWKASRSFAADSLAIGTLGQSAGATAEGLRGVAPSWPRFGANAQAYQRLWQAGPPPRYRQPYDTEAFDAVVLCYLSAVAAGSTRGSQIRNWVRKVSSPPGTKYTWLQLPQAIKALEAGTDIDYQGASGPIDIEPLDTVEPGDPTVGFYDAYRIKDARFSLFGTLAVPGSIQGFKPIATEYVISGAPGTGQQPPTGTTGSTGPTGATGASGPSGATGAKFPKPSKPKKR